MANTFSQIYIQTVFAVSNRESLLKPAFKEEVYKYISGIVRNQGQKLIAINGIADHVHILIGLRPSIALADLMRDIKATHQISLTNTNGFTADSVGRTVTALFLTAIRSWTQSFVTFKIRKSIIVDGRLGTNTWRS